MINIKISCHVILILIVYSFLISLKSIVSPHLIVLRSETAPASCFATLLTDVLIVVTVFLTPNHFFTINMPITQLKTTNETCNDNYS